METKKRRRSTLRKAVDKKHAVKDKLIEMYGSSCFYCQKALPKDKLTLDHIYPIVELGKDKTPAQRKFLRLKSTTVGSTILACGKCNVLKGCRIVSIEDFRKEVMGSNYIPSEEIKVPKKEKKSVQKVQQTRYSKKKEKYPMAKDIVYPDNSGFMSEKEYMQKYATKNSMLKVFMGKIKKTIYTALHKKV